MRNLHAFKNYLCILDYHSKFPIVKRAEDKSAESLTIACKVFFLEFGLLKQITSDVGGNFISDKFKQFCKNMNIEQATSSSSYHHPKQWMGRGLYKIRKAYYEKMY